MAGNIDIIDQVVSKQALDDLDNLNTRLAGSYTAMEDLLGKIQELETAYGKYGKSLSEINSLSNETNKAVREKETLEKEVLALLREKEKLVRETLKTEQESLKTEAQKQKTEREAIKTREAGAKAAERQAKADKKAEDAMRSQEGSINRMRQLMAGLVVEYNRADEATRKKLAPAIKQLQDRINSANADISRHQGYVGNYSRALMGVGTKIMGAFGIVGGISMLAKTVKNGFSTIIKFEQANVNLATVLGKNVKNIKALTDSAKQLGSATEWMASQVTYLQTELAKLGFSEQQILAMQKPVLQFATATGAELPEAAKLAGAALKSFDMSAAETERAVGVMTVGTNKSALSFEYLETAMATAAPVAKAYGLTIEDTVALLGALADAGFDASSAATATRNILLNLANANGKLAKELGKPVKTIPDLVKALNDLKAKGTDLNKTLELTDKRSVAAFNTFMRGTDSLSKLRNELENVDGELERIQKERLDTVEGSVKLLQSSWEALILSFSNSAGPIKSVIDGITKIIDTVNKAVKAVDDLGKPKTETSAYAKMQQEWRGRAAERYKDLFEKEMKAGKDLAEIYEREYAEVSGYLADYQKEMDDLQKKIFGNSGKYTSIDPNNNRKSAKTKEDAHMYEFLTTNIDADTAKLEELLKAYERLKPPVTPPEDTTPTDTANGAIDPKKLADNMRTLGLIEVFRLKKSAEINRQIAKDDKETYDKRREAAEAAARDAISAVEKERDAEIAAVNIKEKAEGISAEEAANQRTLIAEKAAYEIVKIEQNRADEINEINLAEAKNRLKAAQDAIEDRRNMLNNDMQEELVATAKAYEEQIRRNTNNEDRRREITEAYQKQRLDIIRKYNRQAFELEIESLNTLIDAVGLTEEQKADVRKKMDDLRAKNAKELAEYEIELAEYRADKIVGIEERLNRLLNDTRVKLAQEAFDILLETMNLYYDAQLARIDEQEKRQEEHYKNELKQIEEAADAGVIAQETADAERRAIEASQEQREKAYEQQRKEVQRKQAVWQKAQAIVQATINTAQAVTAALTIPIAGIALAAVVAALGAAQVAMIASQPIPSYKEGTENHPGGFARVGDGGRAEMVILPSGKVWKTPAVDTLAYLPRGSEVLPDFKQAVMNTLSVPRPIYYDGRTDDVTTFDDVLRKNTKDANAHLASLNTHLRALRANSVYSGQKATLMYKLNRISRKQYE
jgi:TP901 family phage tail tape measure protein